MISLSIFFLHDLKNRNDGITDKSTYLLFDLLNDSILIDKNTIFLIHIETTKPSICDAKI